MIPLHIIVAIDQNNGIGYEGGLPWSLPGDLKHFKTLTTHTTDAQRRNAVIMGRKTWESIPERFRPLSQRRNVVLSRNPSLNLPDGVRLASSLEEAMNGLETEASPSLVEQVFVIGGEAVFREALTRKELGNLYVTHIHKAFDCDTFFPEFRDAFQETESEPILSENGVSYHFSVYRRE